MTESFDPPPIPTSPPDLALLLVPSAEAKDGQPSPLSELEDDEQMLVQRAVAALAHAKTEAGRYGAADNRLAALMQSYMAAHPDELGLQLDETATRIETKYDNHDPRYVKALIPYIRNWLGIPHRDERPELADQPHQLAEKVRLAIFGDWGSGLYGAQAVARRITEDGSYDAAVHIGDTYYSGSVDEIQHNLVDLLPTVKAEGVRRLCSSNHEMYSGGKPFYDIALGKCDQLSTVFTLRNDTWVFIGLDTGFEDGHIDSDQVTWIEQEIATLEPGKKLVLFTHHHLWSTSKKPNESLLAELAPVLQYGVVAWYWGHVHACELFDPASVSWQVPPFHGRCIGHGGYPYFRQTFDDETATISTPQPNIVLRQVEATDTRPGALVLDGPNEYLGDDADDYGPNGFLRLEIDGPILREVLISPDGTELWTNSIG